MASVQAIREPMTMAAVVQYLAQAPSFGQVIISFRAGRPVLLEIRETIRLDEEGATPAPA